jgi:hypothetical protein
VIPGTTVMVRLAICKDTISESILVTCANWIDGDLPRTRIAERALFASDSADQEIQMQLDCFLIVEGYSYVRKGFEIEWKLAIIRQKQ